MIPGLRIVLLMPLLAGLLSVEAWGQAPSLAARNREFLSLVGNRVPSELLPFFPSAGELIYRHTVHSEDGLSVRETRFAASELPAALEDGPLYSVLATAVEGQLIGLFAHQLTFRGRRWRYVEGNRFVPPDADRCSAIFVEWRVENGTWVVAAIGDEEFNAKNLPSWCC